MTDSTQGKTARGWIAPALYDGLPRHVQMQLDMLYVRFSQPLPPWYRFFKRERVSQDKLIAGMAIVNVIREVNAQRDEERANRDAGC